MLERELAFVTPLELRPHLGLDPTGNPIERRFHQGLETTPGSS